MTTGLKQLGDLEEERELLRAKLAYVDQKMAALLESENAIRVEMQRVENQIYRLKKLQTL